MTDRDPEVQALLDKQAVREVVLRYCRGIDRHDRDLVRDCYWPEATDEHGSFTGSRDEYVAWIFDRVLPRYRMTYHFVGNVLIELDAAAPHRARSESYGISWHRVDSDKPEHNLQTAFRYVDDFERRTDDARSEWRIARRICTLEWCRVNDPAQWWEAPPSHRRGVRDRTDPVYWSWGEPA
jgi:hypothetical protein